MRAIRYVLASTLLLACGDDGVHHLADGGTDGNGDLDGGPQVDAVTVTVTNGGSAAADVKVYFLADDNTVISNTTTKATGDASATMPDGGTVTVLAPPPVSPPGVSTQDQLFTFTGVKPGDHLFVDEGFVAQGASATFNVTLPTDPDGAINYQISSLCGSVDVSPPQLPQAQNQPVEATFSGCPATVDWFVTSFFTNGSGDTTEDFLLAQDIPIADGVDVSIDDTDTYAPILTRNVTATNVDAAALGVQYNLELFTDKGDLQTSFFADGGTPDGGTSIGALQMPTATDGLVGSLSIDVNYQANGPTVIEFLQAITQWGPLPADDVTVDTSTKQLKHVVSVPDFDFATHTVSWDVDTTGADGDVSIIEADFNRITDANAGDSQFWSWQIISADPSSGKIVFPVLPTDVRDFNANETDTFQFNILEIAKFPGGYDAIRPIAFTQQLTPTDLAPTGEAIGQLVEPPSPQFSAHRAAAPKLGKVWPGPRARTHVEHAKLRR